MKIVEPSVAVAAVPDGATLVVPGACAEPARFFAAFSAAVERFNRLTVCSGLSLGHYPFLERGLGEHFHYLTWQAAPRLRTLFRENDRRKVSFVPLRLSDVVRVVRRGGPIEPDAVVVETSLPQPDGTVSLGISVGANPHFVAEAGLVIAEMNARMPVTGGDSRIPIEAIDYAIEADRPLVEYDTGTARPRDERIVEHVLSLIPEGATVQLGIGAVPDRILAGLGGVAGISLFSGMLSQGLVDFMRQARATPRVVTGELSGLASLYEFSDANAAISMAPMSVTHDPPTLAQFERFVSINSAIEIDLQGQSNGETLGATQISGVGGSLDYIEAAALSSGGLSIIAMPSTTAGDRHSKIVARLADGAVVTTPRFCVDAVVTEYGVARLRGRSLWQRAEALIAIAHPDFRDALADGLG